MGVEISHYILIHGSESKMKSMLRSSLVILWLIVGTEEFQSVNPAGSSCMNSVVDEGLNTILSDGGLQFSLNLYDKLKTGTNVIFSPFSVRVALAMTDVGAGGSTLSQMDKALLLNLFSTADQPLLAFQSFLRSFCPDDKFSLSTANRIYMKKDFFIDPSFTNKIEKFYLSGAENVDFKANPTGVAKTINQWVELQTNNTIKNLIDPASLTPETIMVLVNAIYFKGKWKEPFDRPNPGTFFLASGQPITVPTMFKKSHFNYTFNTVLNSQVLRLDYQGDRVAMFIILPANGTSLSSVQQMLNFNNILDCVNKVDVSVQKVNVHLPKFKANFREELKAPLQLLGMVDAFNEATADFSRMTSFPKVRVDQVIHQAFVVVDEEGTMAAAATAVLMPIPVSLPPPELPPIEFKVDRPCIYFLYDLKYKEMLFMGNLDNPTLS